MKGRLAGEPTQIRKKIKNEKNEKTTHFLNSTSRLDGCIVEDNILVLVFQISRDQIRLER